MKPVEETENECSTEQPGTARIGYPRAMRRFEDRLATSASPTHLWEVLVDFPHWPAWNTLTAKAPRGLEVGVPLKLTIPLGSARIPARAELVEVTPRRALVWRGGPPGLFRALHGFRIQPTDTGSEVLHFEVFRGLFANRILTWLGPEHERHYGEVNRALAARAEQRPRGGPVRGSAHLK